MSETPHTTGPGPDPAERLNLLEVAGRAVDYGAIAYHGLRAGILERRLNSAEEASREFDHESAFFGSLGEVAEQVVEDESFAGDQNHPARHPNLPRKPEYSRFAPTGAFSAQADSLKRQRLFSAHGVNEISQIPHAALDSLTSEKLANDAEEKELLESNLVDPRDRTQIIRARDRKQHKAERHVAKQVLKIRERRDDQSRRRRMLGHTGPNQFWRTKLGNVLSGIRDRRDFSKNRITAFEVETRKENRHGKMKHGEWGSIRETARRLERDGDMLLGTMAKTSERAGKKRDRKIRKADKLEDKLIERRAKLDGARARTRS